MCQGKLLLQKPAKQIYKCSREDVRQQSGPPMDNIRYGLPCRLIDPRPGCRSRGRKAASNFYLTDVLTFEQSFYDEYDMNLRFESA